MTWLFVLGYVLIIGSILMEEDSELKYVRGLISQHLNHKGIGVDITLHNDGNVSLSATKAVGNNIKHIKVHSTGLTEAVWKLIKHVEQNSEDWIEKELY